MTYYVEENRSTQLGKNERKKPGRGLKPLNRPLILINRQTAPSINRKKLFCV